MTATRLGLSFSDLNALSFQGFGDFVHLWILGQDPKESGRPRQATQDDINALLG